MMVAAKIGAVIGVVLLGGAAHSIVLVGCVIIATTRQAWFDE